MTSIYSLQDKAGLACLRMTIQKLAESTTKLGVRPKAVECKKNLCKEKNIYF